MIMKKLFVMAALMGCASLQASAEVVGDTIVIKDAEKVRIENSASEQRIFIEGAKYDSDFRYNQAIPYSDSSAVKRELKSSRCLDNYVVKDNKEALKTPKWTPGGYVNLGLGTMVGAPDGYSFKVWPSWEIGAGLTGEWRPFGEKNVWSIGFGIGWRYYRMSNATYWVKTDNVMGLAPYAAGQDDRVTSMTAFSLQVPITYTHYFTDEDGWGFTVGGIVNFNTGAHATREYSVGDEDFDIDLNKIGQRPVTIDLLAVVRIPSFPDVYCKYSPMKFFKSGRGPEMNQLSFGVYF